MPTPVKESEPRAPAPSAPGLPPVQLRTAALEYVLANYAEWMRGFEAARAKFIWGTPEFREALRHAVELLVQYRSATFGPPMRRQLARRQQATRKQR